MKAQSLAVTILGFVMLLCGALAQADGDICTMSKGGYGHFLAGQCVGDDGQIEPANEVYLKSYSGDTGYIHGYNSGNSCLLPDGTVGTTVWTTSGWICR